MFQLLSLFLFDPNKLVMNFLWQMIQCTVLILHSKKCWVKKGRTQRLGCFDPAVGRGGKSRFQKVKVLPYVYSNSAADFTRGGTKSFLSSHKQVSSQMPSPQRDKVNEMIKRLKKATSLKKRETQKHMT